MHKHAIYPKMIHKFAGYALGETRARFRTVINILQA